jgi:hypothetical protein
MPATTRRPNHDAAGNDLTGQPVNYNLNTTDRIVIGGYVYTVVDTYPAGVRVARGLTSEVIAYRELIRRGAFFAKINN